MAATTDWSGAASTVQNSVYLGTWTNWSRGKIMGATLTLDRTDGNFLIAFTAIFVGIVTSRLWRIACFVFHRHYSTPRPRDALHHQRQAILRNSGSAVSSLYTFLHLIWAWQNMTSSPFLRTLPALVTATLCIVAFAVVGGYSSQISSALKNEVLLNGTKCAIVWDPFTTESMSTMNSYWSTLVANAANYAQQCYQTTPGIFDCTHFVKNNLPATVDNRASCPFQSEICRSDSSNIRLDTGYIDIMHDLGINTPSDETVQYRTVLHCAPLKTEGYFSHHNTTEGNFTAYNYGYSSFSPSFTNATHVIESLQSQYNKRIRIPRHRWGKSMILTVLTNWIVYGALDTSRSEFMAIDALNRLDADLLLVFLSGNGIEFFKATEDPWYRATAEGGTATYFVNETVQLYTPQEASSPLGCIQQYQFCNPSLPRDSRCGPLTSWWDAVLGSAALFNVTEEDLSISNFPSHQIGSKFAWSFMQARAATANVRDVISSLGYKALVSQQYLSYGIMGELPENQWQIDVSNWFSIYLSSMQAGVVNSALGPSDPALDAYTILPPNDHVRQLCNNQKILSTEYISFSLFGLYFTYLTGILLIVISYVLEPIYACLYRRRRYGKYAFLEWAATETLQLQRASYQGIKSGTWSGHSNVIPRTEKGEILGDLPFPCAEVEGDVVESADSPRSVKSGNSPTVPPFISPRASVGGLSLDELILDYESSINIDRSSRSVN